MRLSWPTGLVLLAGAIVFMKAQTPQTSAVAPKSASRAFDDAVLPVLEQSCLRCHSAQIASGGLNLESLKNADSLPSHRDEWRMVLLRLKAGEMPPPSVPRPAGLDRMISYLDGQFDMLDRNTQVDPGRITARHLNRAEYRNTVRDLLGVDFQTAQEFPVDDSGEGFDNIGDILSVSPLLAEKYLSAAERIAARALGLVKLPPEPLSNSYADDEHYSEVVGITGNSGSAHSAGTGFMEVTHRVDYDGDYVIQAGLAGQRGADAKPVEMGFWMDGKLLHSERWKPRRRRRCISAPTRGKNSRCSSRRRHTFRLGFANDAYGAALPKDKVFNLKANKYPQLIGFLGPEQAAEDARRAQGNPDLRSQFRAGLYRPYPFHSGAPRLPQAGV